ncbi:serine/threonine-protein kinase [Nannocystis sp.]|uniref:serine/threonine-protein kinase n=1 Tax=Nannocystis sp. TaxID=1962667 RepID=UPI0025FBD3DB|nr:serine/threonine-protein kinase [Nannocystis sp.]
MTVPAPSRLADSGPDRWSSSSGSSNTSRRASSPDDQITVAGSDAPQLATQAGDEFAPGAVISRYMVLSRLGSGAMGVVYAAYDPELDRKVALKLLHPRSGSSLDSKVRLMREAKALARLSHPNVVAVHDVGTFADRVFLAMEFIDGKTLGAWLKEKAQPRPWREVLAILGKAGEGLAAAHAAGLIHRDFKPDNVLIARDGRVRVLDFGLARSAADASPEDTEVDPAAAAVLASVSSERRERSQTEAALLTRTGALVGTPAYMSPEQHLGRFADPRSDQFSFCVALYQALYGVRPFGGERMTSLAFQVLQGKVGAAPPGTTVPAWLRRIVLRGLNVDPELRYPGMPELLADLDRHSGGGKRRRGLLLASAALVGLGLWLGLRATANTPTPCQGAPLHLRGTWDPERSAALGEVFRTSKLPYAAATWASVRPSLDLYALRWTHAFTDACEDTHVRGEQSGQLLDLRMACLERRRIELHELTEVLQAGDTAAIEKASEGVSGLGDLAACADVTALTALVEPPTGTLKEDVERVTAGIARASALELAARWTEAAELTAAAIADPATAAYPPLLAAALRVHARVQRRLGATAEAAESLRSATQAAARGRDDRAAAEAWIDLVFLAGAYLNQAELTHAYTLAATATVLRSGADPLLRAHLDANTFVAQIRLGDPDLAAGDRALAYFEANPDADPNEHHRVLNSLGIVRMHRGEKQGARDLFERALKLGRQHFGADHPTNAIVLSNLAVLALAEKHPEEARRHADESAKIRRVLPENHLDHADTEEVYAAIAEARDETSVAAHHYRRALAIYEAGPHPPPTKIGALHNNMAILAVAEDRPRDAIHEYRSALAAFRQVSPDNEYTLTVEENLAQSLLTVGDLADARSLQDHVILLLQARNGPQHPDTAAARAVQAQILLALGEPGEARVLLEDALPVLEQAGPDYRPRRGLARYTLARCLAALHHDPPQQQRLLELAGADLDGDPDPASQRALAELRARDPSILPPAPR